MIHTGNTKSGAQVYDYCTKNHSYWEVVVGLCDFPINLPRIVTIVNREKGIYIGKNSGGEWRKLP